MSSPQDRHQPRLDCSAARSLSEPVGGWYLTRFLADLDGRARAELHERIINELTTTFASSYADTVSLANLTDPALHRRLTRMATADKILVQPHPTPKGSQS